MGNWIFLSVVIAVVIMALALVAVYSVTDGDSKTPPWAIIVAVVVAIVVAVGLVVGGWWIFGAIAAGGGFAWFVIANSSGSRRPKAAIGCAIAVVAVCVIVATAGWFCRPEVAKTSGAEAEYVPAGTYPAADFAPPEGAGRDGLYFRGRQIRTPVPAGSLKIVEDEVIVETKLPYK